MAGVDWYIVPRESGKSLAKEVSLLILTNGPRVEKSRLILVVNLNIL
jgi:hypothetical protein